MKAEEVYTLIQAMFPGFLDLLYRQGKWSAWCNYAQVASGDTLEELLKNAWSVFKLTNIDSPHLREQKGKMEEDINRLIQLTSNLQAN